MVFDTICTRLLIFIKIPLTRYLKVWIISLGTTFERGNPGKVESQKKIVTRLGRRKRNYAASNNNGKAS